MRITAELGDTRLPKRFWDKVSIFAATGCWEWTARKSPKGYGAFNFSDRTWQAHRLSATVLINPIGEGLVVDHLCDNRSCVNPSHLDIVSPQHNSFVGWGPSAFMARLETCKNGHPFDAVDGGGRVCSECRRSYNREQQRTRRLDPAQIIKDRIRGRIYDAKRRQRVET